MKTLLTTIALTVIGNGTTFAASTAGRTDHSGILVWGFLGFCGLIVVSQLLPAILMTLGIFNSFKEIDYTEVKDTTK